MKTNHMLAVAAIAAALSLYTSNIQAQDTTPATPGQGQGGGRQRGGGGGGGGGNFDPAQFQQRMMDRTMETLEVTDDTERKALEPLVTKVMEARMATMSGMGRGMFGGGRGGRGGQGGGATQDQANGNGNQRRGGMFGGQAMPEADTLQKAIDAKASKAEMKAALEKYAEARKAKQGELEKAQADLRKVLTLRQEALATLNGLL